MTNVSRPEVRQLEKLLQEKLLPWLEKQAPVVLFDAPPRCFPPLDVRERATSKLPRVTPQRMYPHLQLWPAEHLNAISAPMLGCVFDGEADYRIHRPPCERGDQWIVTLKTGTLFSIMPGIPFSGCGTMPWERTKPKDAYSRIFLMQLRPEGVIYHSFTSDKGKLWIHPYIFLYNFEVLSLGEKLQEEMRRPQPSLSAIYLYWQLIFTLLIRTIHEGDVSVLETPTAESFGLAGESVTANAALKNETAVKLAEQYIQSYLHTPHLKVLSIAQHAGVSQRHLNRLFQNTHKKSPFAYVQQKRLEKACVLLQHSRLSIRQVASYCGFIKMSHFSTWFARQMHQSPRQFRDEKRGMAVI